MALKNIHLTLPGLGTTYLEYTLFKKQHNVDSCLHYHPFTKQVHKLFFLPMVLLFVVAPIPRVLHSNSTNGKHFQPIIFFVSVPQNKLFGDQYFAKETYRTLCSTLFFILFPGQHREGSPSILP